MKKEFIIEQYLIFAKKLNKTPSVNDIKAERKINPDFPSMYWIKKHFKTSNNLAKQCGLEQNKRNLELISERNVKSLRVFLRNYCTKWRRDSIEYWKELSCVSGKKYDVVHHDYSFSNIMDEIFEVTGLMKSNSIDNYSQEELLKMGEICESLHYKHGLGYCLTNSEHKEIHSLWGYDASGKMKEYIEYKKNNKEINNQSAFDILNNSEIIIFQNEIESMLKLPNFLCQKTFFILLMFNKVFSNINNEFYLPYSQIRKNHISGSSFTKYKKYLLDNDYLYERKVVDKKIKNIYKLNVQSDINSNNIVLKINEDINYMIFYCIYKFYKEKKIIKTILSRRNYSLYNKYYKKFFKDNN